jgi:hypothetical protein
VGEQGRVIVSKNAKGFVAAVVLGLVAAAVVVAGFLTARGAAATLGLISGIGLVLLGQVLRRPAASPKRRTNAIAAAVGILALPVVGLVLGAGAKDDLATFVSGFLLPMCAFLIVAALAAAAKDPAYWRR